MDNALVNKIEFIDPLTDIGFKALFGNENYKDVLISFLNGLLMGKKIIHSLEFGPTEHIGNFDKRTVYFDLFCTGINGEQFIVEMQHKGHAHFRDRSVYYTSRLITDQIAVGQNSDYRLKEVIFIGILNFNFNKSIGKGHVNHICLTNRNTGEIFYEKLDYIFVELPKFVKPLHECVTVLDKWLYVLRNLRKMTSIPETLNEGIFKKVFKITNLKNMNQKTLEDFRALNPITERYAKEYAEEEARNEGKIEIISAMILNNYSNAEISKMTNLPEEEIENLIQYGNMKI